MAAVSLHESSDVSSLQAAKAWILETPGSARCLCAGPGAGLGGAGLGAGAGPAGAGAAGAARSGTRAPNRVTHGTPIMFTKRLFQCKY